MNLKPIYATYVFSIPNHTIIATAKHKDNEREISYFYDDKLISQRSVPDGDLLSDDDYIRDLVENHCKTSIDAFSDLFNNHSNKILLISKSVKVLIDNFGIEIMAIVKVYNNRHEIELSTLDGEDKFSGTFASNNFPDVLEKLRLFINTLSGVSSDLTTHIDELSNDKIEALIKWI